MSQPAHKQAQLYQNFKDSFSTARRWLLILFFEVHTQRFWRTTWQPPKKVQSRTQQTYAHFQPNLSHIQSDIHLPSHHLQRPSLQLHEVPDPVQYPANQLLIAAKDWSIERTVEKETEAIRFSSPAFGFVHSSMTVQEANTTPKLYLNTIWIQFTLYLLYVAL